MKELLLLGSQDPDNYEKIRPKFTNVAVYITRYSRIQNSWTYRQSLIPVVNIILP